jgi:putative RNA 2'-phosphotransferase
MIRDCETHGYFRDETCPLCGEEGKFLLSDYEVEKIGRTMAAILRHGKYDLEMDEQGFVDMRDVVKAIKDRNPRMKWLRTHHIEAMVETDPKGRYQVSGADVRATYGHTIKLELNLPTDNIPDKLYYPATPEECDAIMENGIQPIDRSMVHLSKTFWDALSAGSVHTEAPIILEVDVLGCEKAGIKIGKAAKTVFLCDGVPPQFLMAVDEDDMECESETDSEDE